MSRRDEDQLSFSFPNPEDPTSADDLPEGWVWIQLSDIVEPSKERVDPEDFGESPYLSLEHIEAHTHQIIGRGRGADVKSTKAVFRAGDVLYGKLRPYLNKVAIPDFDGICSTDILVFTRRRLLDNRYLFHFLCQEQVVQFANHHAKGVNLPRISFKKFGELAFPLPPLAEQQRIVAQVDRLLAVVRKTKARLEGVQATLAQFRQAVLDAACSGRLTEDWRADHPDVEPAEVLLARVQNERQENYERELAHAKREHRRSRYKRPEVAPGPTVDELQSFPDLPNGWIYTRLGNLGEVVRGASPRPAGDPRFFGGNIPWITVGEITKNDEPFLSSVSSYLTKDGREKSRFIQQDTFLITNSGATLGVPKISQIDGCINDGSVAIFDIPLVSKLYLYYFIKSQTEKLRQINRGVGQPNLNTTIIKTIVIPLPPIDEQVIITTIIQKAFALADELEDKVARALRRNEAMRQGILAQAFRGALVPTEAELARHERRPYEPAAALLQRIQAAQAARQAERRTRKKKAVTRKKKAQTRRPLPEVLAEAGTRLTPEALFAQAGFTAETVEAFYDELKAAVAAEQIREVRPDDTDVFLEAASA